MTKLTMDYNNRKRIEMMNLENKCVYRNIHTEHKEALKKAQFCRIVHGTYGGLCDVFEIFKKRLEEYKNKQEEQK